MTAGQKVAFSALFSIGLFGAFVYVTKTDFIPEIEKRFYTQSKVQQKEDELNNVTKGIDSYIQNILNDLENKETGYLNSSAVSSYLSQNPAESDTVERRNITEKLFYEHPALKGIRFVDKNGVNLHFSTYDRTDVAKHVGIKKYYKNYPDLVEEYKELDVKKIFSEKKQPEKKIYFDENKNRFILALPVNWLEDVYAGCFLFYFDVNSLTDSFSSEGIIRFSDNLKIISDEKYNGGFVLGLPSENTEVFVESIKSSWKEKNQKTSAGNLLLANNQIEKIVTQKDGTNWVMMNSQNKNDYKLSLVVPNSFFELSKEFIYLIYLSIFISLFLVIFLIFSLKKDSVYVLKRKIRKIQFGIIKEYLENKEKIEWKNVAVQLKARNEEITKEIKKSLGRKSKYKSSEIEDILQKSWTEVIDVISSYSPDAMSTTSARNISQNAATFAPTGTANSNSTVTQNSQITIEQIKHVMEEVLKSTTLNVSSTTTKVLPGQNVNKIPVASAAPVEEILEEVEEVEEIEEIEDAEEVLEIAEAVDEIDEVEELSDVEEIEEAEEIEDAEEVLEVAEAVDEIDEVEELSDVEEIEEIEEIEDAEEVLEIAEAVDEIDEVEEISDVEEIEEIEEIEVAQAIELDCLINDQKPEEEKITDVYIISENIPTVDNLFLEELCIGSFEIQTKKAPINFTVYNLDFSVPETKKEDYEDPLEDFLEEIEEADISETIQKPVLSDVKFTNQFSMVSFGMNLGNIQELQQIKEDTIIETEGVFSISDDLDYSKVSQNLDFKTLVDDVLKK
ncbi:MAG: hypothetical protein J6C25_08560 [Treponema sp.]|nr:hypothetical protein [Treponema sp.]